MFFCFKSAIYVYHKYIALTILQIVTPIGNLVYHQYSVPSILQVVTPISLLKKVFLYRFKGEGLPSSLLHLGYFCNKVTWKHIFYSHSYVLKHHLIQAKGTFALL